MKTHRLKKGGTINKDNNSKECGRSHSYIRNIWSDFQERCSTKRVKLRIATAKDTKSKVNLEVWGSIGGIYKF